MDEPTTTDPRRIARAVWDQHQAMWPGSGTCQGCGTKFTDDTTSWEATAEAFDQHLRAALLAELGATEWAVEITWTDWEKAGAKGPTSQNGPCVSEAHRDSYLDACRRDSAIAATRVMTRTAAYTPWVGAEPVPTTVEERDRLLAEHYAKIMAGMGERT